MKTNTYKDYEDAIKEKYKEEKLGRYAQFLVQPTPGNLKKLAIQKFNDSDLADKETYSSFFSFTGTDSFVKQIERFDGDKLKPLCKFLKGDTNTFKNSSSLELLAVLVDFNPRPLKNFLRKGEKEVYKEKEELIDDSTSITENSSVELKNYNNLKHKTKNKLQAITFFVLLFVLGGYVVNDLLTKQCMVWINDHYEAVHCDEQANNSQNLIPLDKETLENQRKISVSDTTRFFLENGNPCIWYAKKDGEIEYFTYHGLHPETGETLRKITDYMISKYVSK